MAALISGVGYQHDCFVPVDGHNYENCVLVGPLHPSYENYSYCTPTNASYVEQLRITRGDYISSSELEDFPVLSEPILQERATSVNKRLQHHYTSIVRTEPGKDMQSHTEDDLHAKKNEETDKKPAKSASGLLRRSLRLSRKSAGSGSNIDKEPSNKKKNKKRSSQKASYCDTSDNGGFESVSPKPVLGVKEKLRYSLDKINFKSPFRWNSSDKLTHLAVKGSQSKKSSRRYSDSNTFFLATDKGVESKKAPSCSKSIDEKPPLGNSGSALSRMVRPYPSTHRESADSEVVFGSKPTSAGNHDYVNLNGNTEPLKVHLQDPIDHRFDSRSRHNVENHHTAVRNANFYHDVATSNLQANPNKNTFSRAKGTWKMLKTNETKQFPSKVENEFFIEGEQETFFPQEFDDCTYANEVGEIMSLEPPKLAPVSGKLLLNKTYENKILKPTAYRPTPASNQNSPLLVYVSNSSPWQQPSNNSEIPTTHPRLGPDKVDVNSSNNSNNSDSGRLSATSIPPGVNILSSFSCSGSEGYESARIPSSTNHSAVHEHEPNVIDSCALSPRKLSDDMVTFRNQVSKQQVQANIAGNDSDDGEARNEVIEETGRSNDSESLKLRSSGQMKLQRRSSANDRQVTEQHFRRLHEEQKQLHDANNKLEERIKSMTEAIDAQSRRDDDDSALQARLEESEVEMQQQRGEISLLKRQIVEKRNELTQRSYELLAVKSHNRDLTLQMSQHESENHSLVNQLADQQRQIAELERLLAATTTPHNYPPRDHRPLTGSRSAYDFSDSTHRFSSHGKSLTDEALMRSAGRLHSPIDAFHPGEKETLHKQLRAIEQQLAMREQEFDHEREQWAEDKRKVIKYQKLLQENYVQMYKRSHALEREVKSLSSQLQRAGLNVINSTSFSASDSDDRPNLCYPMDI